MMDLLYENQNMSEQDKQAFAKFFVDLVVRIEQGDTEAEKLLDSSPEEIQQYIQQANQTEEPVQEAFENIRSKVGGKLAGTDPSLTRYNLLVKAVQKKVWELGEDLKTTNDPNSTAEYDKVVQRIQVIEPNMVPEGGTLQKAGYKVGTSVGKVAKSYGKRAAIMAGVFAPLVALGIPPVVVGGIIGAGLSALKNHSNKKMPLKEKLKRVLISAGIGSTTTFALSELASILGEHNPLD